MTTGAPAKNIRLSPDGSRIAMASATGLQVDLWNPKTGKLIYSLPEETGAIWWLAWSPDSQRLAVTRFNGIISVWNLKEVDAQLQKLDLRTKNPPEKYSLR